MKMKMSQNNFYLNWQVVARCSIKVLSIFTVKPQVLSELTAAGACQYVLLSVTRAPHLVTSSGYSGA
jgi:hypothetical protein